MFLFYVKWRKQSTRWFAALQGALELLGHRPPLRFVVQINIDMLEGLCRRGVQMKIRSQKGAKGSSEGHPEEEEV